MRYAAATLKALRLLLLAVLVLAEPLRAFGVEVMASAAMAHPPAATAQRAQPAAATAADCAMAGMSGDARAAAATPGATDHHPPCPLCSVASATPPAPLAFAPPAPRPSVRRHGSMAFRSVVADALDPPPRSAA